MSKIKVNSIEAATGSTITIPSGQTLDISSTTLTLPSTVVTTTGTQTLTNKTIGVSQLTGTLPVANGGTGLTSLGTASQVLRVNSGATALEFAAISGSVFGTALFHVRDEKSATTNGGTFTAGSFVKRDLNTTLTNEISGASISSSVITLPAGTYYIHASAPASECQFHKAKWRNTTDSSDVIIGTAQHNRSDNNYAVSRSIVIGRFTIAAQKNFELQHRCSTTRGTDGLGMAADLSVVEVYSDVQIWKVA